jgi:hypothetical protein
MPPFAPELTPDREQIAFRVDHHHLQVLHGDAVVTHATGHAVAFERVPETCSYRLRRGALTVGLAVSLGRRLDLWRFMVLRNRALCLTPNDTRPACLSRKRPP